MDQEGRPVEIKDLNKTQLILLAILISFVVSIATGITTVTLMQQAPATVTQTINRVVQHTIEKVVPDYIPGKTQTVIVKEDELVVDAVQKTRTNIFPIFLTKDAPESFADAYSIGKGSFIAVSSQIQSGTSYTINVGNKLYDVRPSGISLLGFSILSINPNTSAPKDLPMALFGKDADVKAGQSAVIVDSQSIARGLVQALVLKDQKDESGKIVATWHTITLDKALSTEMIGALVVNLDGSIVGIVVPKGEAGAQILGIDAVTKAIADIGKVVN
jgi:hypothetical protein